MKGFDQECKNSCILSAISKIVYTTTNIKDYETVDTALRYINAKEIDLSFLLRESPPDRILRSMTNDMKMDTALTKCKLLSAVGMDEVEKVDIIVSSFSKNIPVEIIKKIIKFYKDIKIYKSIYKYMIIRHKNEITFAVDFAMDSGNTKYTSYEQIDSEERERQIVYNEFKFMEDDIMKKLQTIDLSENYLSVFFKK